MGTGSVHLDRDLAPFVKKSFIKHFRQYFEDVLNYTEEKTDKVLNKINKKYKTIELDNIKLKESDEYNQAFSFAEKQLEREGKQATEALYHNLNSLESRAGSQVPFTSINLGRDLTTEGKLIQKWIFNASLNGIGKFHLTPIFPISIYQYKSGENAEPGTPGYEMKQLALKSLSKRIYPNFVNCDWSQAHEDPTNPDTYFSTMGRCKLQLM